MRYKTAVTASIESLYILYVWDGKSLTIVLSVILICKFSKKCRAVSWQENILSGLYMFRKHIRH